ncbi:MAG: UDP-N-acetyl-D-mannosamine dehydrogenase [Pseudomonadota bacterium]
MAALPSICVVGLGYIGLPTAAVFARSGYQVHGVDVNESAVETIKTGKAHIVEMDLDGLLQGVVASGRLTVSTQPQRADTFIIAVPTPFEETKRADLRHVKAAVDAIAPHVAPGNLVIMESTVPPGTTQQMCDWLEAARPDLKEAGGAGVAYHAAHCPERVLPGRVLIELVQNDRVIGGATPACAEKAQALYESFVKGECLLTNMRTAELTKLTENAFRDVNIAFANELSLICDTLDVDVWELIALANRHPRVNILKPGPGVGGHCIAIDPWFIVEKAPEHAQLIALARTINDAKPSAVLEKVYRHAERFKAPKIACLGLTFKADIDDVRDSPALDITQQLAKRFGNNVLAVEPNIEALPASFEDTGAALTTVDAALETADIVVLLVDHKEFKRIPKAKLAEKVLVDTRGLWR